MKSQILCTCLAFPGIRNNPSQSVAFDLKYRKHASTSMGTPLIAFGCSLSFSARLGGVGDRSVEETVDLISLIVALFLGWFVSADASEVSGKHIVVSRIIFCPVTIRIADTIAALEASANPISGVVSAFCTSGTERERARALAELALLLYS